jgi:hypothetical protein
MRFSGTTGTAGRPRRRLDFQRQNNRKPARCHLTTVSGRTTASASQAFGDRWQTQPRTTLSTVKNDSRLGLPRRSTMICCRNTRISASNAARGRIRSTTIQKIILQRSDIPQRIIRFCVSRQLHGIYDRDTNSRSYKHIRATAFQETCTIKSSFPAPSRGRLCVCWDGLVTQDLAAHPPATTAILNRVSQGCHTET